MKIIYRSILCIGIGLSLHGCKNASEDSSSKMNIGFTKEGSAQLLKQNTDSVFVSLDIEFARSSYETQTGLMYRDSMEQHQGMLFIFDDNAPRYFYMKNTRIPLDIIYLSKDKEVVSFYKEAKPFDPTTLPSNAPAKYVLELIGGSIDRLNIEVGDLIQFQEGS